MAIRQECGVLLRGYAKEGSSVSDVVNRLYASVISVRDLGFGKTVVLIPADKDCGKTMSELERVIKSAMTKNVSVFSPHGNENSDVLNEGLANLRYECTYALVMSNKAIEYLTFENIDKLLMPFSKGALVAGLAVRDKAVPQLKDEVYVGVLEGRISNTFAVWDIDALESVGEFDSKIGVEEIAPIILLIGAHGQCVAPVLPSDQKGVNISDLRKEHYSQVVSTKRERQEKEAERAGGTFSMIMDGILSGYPK